MNSTTISKHENRLNKKQVKEFFYLTELNPAHNNKNKESSTIQKYAHDKQALAAQA